MAMFAYRGRNAQGALVDGNIEAANAGAAATRLSGDGIIPLAIDEKREAASGGDSNSALKQLFKRKVDLPDLIMFSRQMYSLSRAGVPILRAFISLADSAANPELGKVLRTVGEDLASGQNLATAMAKHEAVFSSFYVSMVHVGENTGLLDAVFSQLAEHLERDLETRKRIASAFRYPTFVLIAISVAIAIINLMVIPAFAKIFASFHAQLPLATRILLGTSNFFTTYWPLLTVAIIAGTFGWRRYIATEKGRLFWDGKKLRIPLIGSIVHRALLGRFARSFATMSRAGVQLTTALNVVSHVVDNAFVGEKIRGMSAGIERGESITRNAAATNMFSDLVLQMLAVGEETGAIDELLEEVADFYDREVDYDLKRLSDRIEPLMIVFVGFLVLILALGVFLPMWDMASAARGGG
ncbi:MAG TPA: type II secretion system F family protein [Spongiibacteraceae bacterium]